MTKGILTNEGKINKYQPKSRRDSNDYISIENGHIDTIELSPRVKCSNDQDGSTNGTNGKDHANDSSSSNIEHL
jgi:hypothetical protein